METTGKREEKEKEKEKETLPARKKILVKKD